MKEECKLRGGWEGVISPDGTKEMGREISDAAACMSRNENLSSWRAVAGSRAGWKAKVLGTWVALSCAPMGWRLRGASLPLGSSAAGRTLYKLAG